MMHKKREGSNYKIGLNWNIDQYTKCYLGIVIPIWFKLRYDHRVFETGDLISSWSLKLLHIGFRINKNNRWFNRYSIWWRDYGIKLLKTEEELDFETNRCERLLQIINSYGYKWSPEFEVYYSLVEQKVFSTRFLLEEPPAKVVLAFKTLVTRPTIFFVGKPSEYVEKTILSELRLLGD